MYPPGARVRLRKSLVTMIVTMAIASQVQCTWYSNGKLYHQTFLAEDLLLIEGIDSYRSFT